MRHNSVAGQSPPGRPNISLRPLAVRSTSSNSGFSAMYSSHSWEYSARTSAAFTARPVGPLAKTLAPRVLAS